jgi:hypothetical protein
MAMRDITQLMNAYRECSRNLWNVYFSGREDIGGSLDTFGDLQRLLFRALVVDELFYEEQPEGGNIPPPALRVVPRARSPILINRSDKPEGGGYWDQEEDLFVGPEITLAFIDYFDFEQIPIMDFHYFRCKILAFPGHNEHVGRQALVEAVGGKVFHDDGLKG